MNNNSLNADDSKSNQPDDVSKIIDIAIYFKVIVQSIGIVGNLLMIAVYARGTHLSTLSVSAYFQCQAFFCASHNLNNLLVSLVDYSFVDQSNAACKLIIFYKSIITPISYWFELVASLDRFLSIVFPVKFRFIQKARTQRIVVLAVVLFHIACYSPILFVFKLIKQDNADLGERADVYVCEFTLLDYLNILDFINYTAFPFVAMFLLSVATLVGVLQAHRKMKSAVGSHNRTSIRDIKFGITILAMNFIFFILNFPFCLYNLTNIDPFANSLYDSWLFYLILENMFNSYYSIIFYTQLVVNNLVRTEVWNLIKSCLYRIWD